MIDIIQKFIIIYIVIFCFYMIWFYIKSKSKKRKNTLTIEMVYLMNLYKINILTIGKEKLYKAIALINSFIITTDLILYFNIDNLILRFILMFVATLVLIFIMYGLLAKKYRKLL